MVVTVRMFLRFSVYVGGGEWAEVFTPALPGAPAYGFWIVRQEIAREFGEARYLGPTPRQLEVAP